MARRVIFLVFWAMFIIAIVVLNEAAKLRESAQHPNPVELLPQDDKVLRQLSKAIKDKDYISGLQICDQHVIAFEHAPVMDNLQAFQFFYLKGHIHSALWQHIEAGESWTQALKFSTQKTQHEKINRLLRANQHLVNDINDERDNFAVYRASPNVGPAGTLQGKVAVIYVFLTEGALQSWSVREREFTLSNWKYAENWLKLRSQEYSAQITFSQRLFLIEKNPFIKRLRVGDHDQRHHNSKQVAQLVAEHFGFKDVLSFVEAIKKEEAADQAVLIFHIARKGRSFAQRCVSDCQGDAEYVYLMEQPVGKRARFLNYAQAHETLHLFGADDLYNIKAARLYGVRDIMNYPSSMLEASTLEKITAYAVGIEKQKPKTPFEIRTYSRRK